MMTVLGVVLLSAPTAYLAWEVQQARRDIRMLIVVIAGTPFDAVSTAKIKRTIAGGR